MMSKRSFKIQHPWMAMVLAVLVIGQLFSATTGKISGKITDRSTLQALQGATIQVINTGLGNVSIADGSYFIINIPPGTYSVAASYIGYEKIILTDVKVSTNRTTEINFAMNPTVIEGAQVTIMAERPVIAKDLTASEQVVTSDDISKSWVRSMSEILNTQTGVFQGMYRGSSQVESIYMLDNISLNSGLVSDNYSGLNTSTIQEIQVLTGGYNAEYGNARSAVVNVVTKEGMTRGIKGTVIGRMRPAGQYHFGRNLYSKENYDWTNYDLAYWTDQSADPNSEFSGQNPQALLDQWQKSITPNDTLAKYADLSEYETEATLYGSLGERIGFLLSGRYKRGVGVFPQLIPYNPEFNIQTSLSYKLNSSMELKANYLFGGYESANPASTNFNSYESAWESEWYPQMQVNDPYAGNKYRLAGSWSQWPELRKFQEASLKFTHVLNKSTFYNLIFTYLSDKMDRTDRNGIIPPDLWAATDDVQKMVDYFLDKGYQHSWDKTNSQVLMLKGDLTSQINTHHMIKTGFEFKTYDFSYEHVMSYYEGGSRWNLNNVFTGTPFEGALFGQDKIEYAGMIINAGLRLDFFNQNRNAPANRYDPLASETTTPGHDADDPSGIPGTPERVATKLHAVLSPRIGISHPISESTVLHFMYGSFYQRPSWTKMFGFPFISFSEATGAELLDPYAKGTTWMDQWQGYFGNPDLGYEKTTQYELGFEQNIADKFRLDVTGYYKDASNIAGFETRSHVIPAENFYNIPWMLNNSGYSDIRGIEGTLESRLRSAVNFGASYDIFWSWNGVVGYWDMYESGAGMIDVPKGLQNGKGSWAGFSKIKGWVNAYLRPDWGPEVAGMKPLGDWNFYLYGWWRSGTQYTYHGPGDLSTKPNNRRWFPYYELDLKVAKGIKLMGVRAEISMDIRNLLNNKFYSLLYDDDMVKWQERKDLPEEERLPKHWFSDEPNTWAWYTWEVPPRQMYFQIKFDF